MKKLYFAIYLILFVFVETAFAQLPNFTTTPVRSFFQSLNPTQLRSFANEIDSGHWTHGWANHFTLSAHDSLDFANIDTSAKKLFVFGVRIVADQMQAGLAVDYSGMDITDNGTAQTHYEFHTDVIIVYCCPYNIGVSFWIQRKRDN